MKHVNTIAMALLAVSTTACVIVSRRVDVEPVDTRQPTIVSSPVKAHLKDGSTVVYPYGVTVTADALQGDGSRFDLTLMNSTRVDSIPLDLVVGMETFRTRVNGGQTFLVSTLASVGAVFGTAALAVAIFGSCPTVYSDGGAVEEAELFSSSIAPLFEGRDVDRLRAQPDAAGIVSLDVRNEAMETHYINHLQLLEVQHASGEIVVPDLRGQPIVVGGARMPGTIVDRRGRNLTDLLEVADGRFYVTDQRTVHAATAADMDDWIDVTIPVAAGSTSTALVFRLRNSLLNTVLLYEVMLGPAGAGALDWMGEDLTRISTAVELGRWHQRRAGMHISVWRDDAYREVARVPDSGPISWHDVAAVIPVPPGETALRVRLTFLADHWRIDQLRAAFDVREGTPRVVPLAGVAGPHGRAEAEARENLSAPDDRYLQTNPGHRFQARFNVGAAPSGRLRTFLLSSQGYYTEWIRGSWIRNATVTQPFAPTDDAILTALRKWGATRESFEQRFRRARVPVQ